VATALRLASRSDRLGARRIDLVGHRSRSPGTAGRLREAGLEKHFLSGGKPFPSPDIDQIQLTIVSQTLATDLQIGFIESTFISEPSAGLLLGPARSGWERAAAGPETQLSGPRIRVSHRLLLLRYNPR
jgi:hypothetical protein